jgi:hypothetical protein
MALMRVRIAAIPGSIDGYKGCVSMVASDIDFVFRRIFSSRSTQASTRLSRDIQNYFSRTCAPIAALVTAYSRPDVSQIC